MRMFLNVDNRLKHQYYVVRNHVMAALYNAGFFDQMYLSFPGGLSEKSRFIEACLFINAG